MKNSPTKKPKSTSAFKTKTKSPVEAASISRAVNQPIREGTKTIQVTVEFKLAAPTAKSVAVAGSFNNWDPQKTPLNRDSSGWKTAIELLRGNYEYRFVVDGQWLSDPAAQANVPNPFGGVNSLLSL